MPSIKSGFTTTVCLPSEPFAKSPFANPFCIAFEKNCWSFGSTVTIKAELSVRAEGCTSKPRVLLAFKLPSLKKAIVSCSRSGGPGCDSLAARFREAATKSTPDLEAHHLGRWPTLYLSKILGCPVHRNPLQARIGRSHRAQWYDLSRTLWKIRKARAVCY